jgi:hypothetical protein
MGKLMERLEKQLATEYKKDAEECIEIFNWLKSTDKDGRVWESKWTTLTDVKFTGFTSNDRRYYPSIAGKTLLRNINIDVKEKMYTLEEMYLSAANVVTQIAANRGNSEWYIKITPKMIVDNWIEKNL